MATGSNSTADTGITIRRATTDDFTQLVVLLDRYYTEWYVWEHDPPERVLRYIEQPSPFGYLVAEFEGSLIGCVMLRPIPSIPSAAECKRLFIAPEVRGRGLASQLMDRVEALATNSLAWICLDTDDQFTAAISLYRARGYESCERFNDNSQATFFFRKHLAG